MRHANGNIDGNTRDTDGNSHGNGDGQLHTGNGVADSCTVPGPRCIRWGGYIQRNAVLHGGRLQLLDRRQRP